MASSPSRPVERKQEQTGNPAEGKDSTAGVFHAMNRWGHLLTLMSDRPQDVFRDIGKVTLFYDLKYVIDVFYH